MRSWPVLVSLTTIVAAGIAPPVWAGSSAADRQERVRALRRQVEQNDAQIRVLEETVRKLQTGKVSVEPAKRMPAPTGSLGEISAWSTTAPATGAPTATATPPTPSPVVTTAPVVAAPRDTGSRSRSASRAPIRPGRARSLLAAAPLKHGMTQVKVWETLGPPEFVRGRRAEVQYWHYGPGWIRFQAGRITRWEPGSSELRAARE
jgi:hypothetical protein